MRLSTKTMDEVLRSVLDVMLHLGPSELERSGLPEAEPMVQAQIQIRGQWTGRLLLQVEPSLAREMAAVMMSADPRELSSVESHDVVGELANMIAGNLRPLVQGSRSVSLPTVTQERLGRLPKASFPLELNYRLDGRPITLSVADAAALN